MHYPWQNAQSSEGARYRKDELQYNVIIICMGIYFYGHQKEIYSENSLGTYSFIHYTQG